MLCPNVSVAQEFRKLAKTNLEEYLKMSWEDENMDNGGFRRDVEEGTELGLVDNTKTASSSINGTKTNSNSKSTVSTLPGTSYSCKSEVCETARTRFQGPGLSPAGPWHRNKTIFLIITIVLLIIWIIVYAVLNNLDLL